MSLGEYRQAIDLHTQALAIARDIGDRQGEGVTLGNLGNCHTSLGEYRQAIDLHTQALAIARDIGDRYGEANALDYLGRAWLASGEARRAVTLLEQAVSIADTTGDIEPAVEARSWLARARLQLGDPAAALTAAAAGRELPYPAGEPALRLLEGLALLELHRARRACGRSAARSRPPTRCWPSRTATWPRCRPAHWRWADSPRPPATRPGPRRRVRPSPGPMPSPAPRAWPQTPAACTIRSPATTGPASSPGSAPHQIRDGHQPGPGQPIRPRARGGC